MWLARRSLATEAGRLALDTSLLRVPVLGNFARDTDVVRFARTLSLLVKAGISVDRALALSGNTLVNRRLRAAILAACPEANEVGDRAEAILRAVDAALPGDAVLIAGKGHESGQIVGTDVYPFDDVEQASIAVAALDGVDAAHRPALTGTWPGQDDPVVLAVVEETA